MSRGWKWSAVVAVTLLALLVSVWSIMRDRARSELRVALATTTARLQAASKRVYTRSAPRGAPADRERGSAPLEARAIYQRVAASFAHIDMEDYDDPDTEALIFAMSEFVEATEESGATARAFLGRHAAPLAELDKAMHAKRVLDDSRRGKDTTRHWTSRKHTERLSDILRGAAEFYFQQKRPAEALHAAALDLLMWTDLGRSRALWSVSRRRGCQLWFCSLVRRTVGAFVLDRTVLTDLVPVVALADAANTRDLTDWRLSADEVSRELAGAILERIESRAFCDLKVGIRDLYCVELVAMREIKCIDAIVADAKMWRVLPFKLAEARASSRLVRAQGEGYQVADTFAWNVWGELEYRRRTDMHWTLLKVALAVARHRSTHSRFPASLDEAGVGEVICPVSELPLRYTPGRLWSIGGDGDDDGGRPPDNDHHEGQFLYADHDFPWDLTKAKPAPSR